MEWLTLDTWIVSDTHFGHQNIIRYCNRPENHDELMLERWQAAVAAHEPLLHLGDVIFWKTDELLRERVLRLPGEKRLIKGNHDRRISRLREGHNGFVEIFEQVKFNWNGRPVLFTHRPSMDSGWSINIHGHIHNNGYDSLVDRTRDYRNVSVEVMGYKPVRLREILEIGCYQAISDAPTPR